MRVSRLAGRLLPASSRLATYLVALWRLARDSRTPVPAKAVAWFVLAYALSPIDLIPDFIPVLGQLDDLILIPLGVMLVIRLVPATLWQETMLDAQAQAARLPRLWWGAALVVLVWLAMLALFVWWLAGWLRAGAGV